LTRISFGLCSSPAHGGDEGMLVFIQYDWQCLLCTYNSIIPLIVEHLSAHGNRDMQEETRVQSFTREEFVPAWIRCLPPIPRRDNFVLGVVCSGTIIIFYFCRNLVV
jgi:hypothetical protein